MSDLEELKLDGGYDAVLLATGTPRATGLDVPGEQLDGVISGLDFLRDVRLGSAAQLGGKRVVIVGGGNVAMDAARTVRRLGASRHAGRVSAWPRTDARARCRGRRR